jgi:hypothetical protein
MLYSAGSGSLLADCKKSPPWPFSTQAFQRAMLRGVYSLVAVLACGASSAAERGGCDVIETAGGGEIRGAVLRRGADGSVDVAVQRDWLAAHAPEAAAALAAEERPQVRQVREQLRQRLEQRIDELPESKTRSLALLRRELVRVEAELAADAGEDTPAGPQQPEQTQFALLRIAAKRVRRIRAAEPAAKNVARWAWGERLKDVEQRSAADMNAELVTRGIDPAQEPPHLGARLPPLPQAEREWQARLALIDDALSVPVAFQGTGDLLVRTDNAEPGMTALLPLLTQMLGGGGPPAPQAPGAAGRPDWLESARSQASEEGHFRATRLHLDPVGRRVKVESVFVVKMGDGSWETIWRDEQVLGADAAPAGAAERIQADPQVGPLLEAARGLGLADAATLKQAIGLGAATLAAQSRCDSRFNAFRSDYTRRLDGPPLRWDNR